MERELWPPLYRALRHVANAFSQKYVQHQPWVLDAVVLWAALHGRPASWACQRRARLPPARSQGREAELRKNDRSRVPTVMQRRR